MKRDRKGWQKRGSDGDEPAGGGGMVSARWVWSGLDEKGLQWNKHVKEYTVLGVPGQENQVVSVHFIFYWERKADVRHR